MAITGTLLTAAGSTSNATSYATATITPGSGRLVLAAVTGDDGLSTTPSLTGCSLTWVLVAEVVVPTTLYRLAVFRAMGTPTEGAVTISFGAAGQLNCNWTIVEFSGVDTTGTNGSGAIVQALTNTKTASCCPVALTVTLAAFSGSNATFGAGLNDGSATAFTAGSGWTDFGVVAGESARLDAEWKAVPDTSVDWSATDTRAAGIGIEIKAGLTQWTSRAPMMGIG